MKIGFDSKTISNNFNELKQEAKSFGQIFKDALMAANMYQKEYESQLNLQMLNDEVDLHNVIIAGEKARISLELTLQIRNKAMEAYQEIMRMQI